LSEYKFVAEPFFFFKRNIRQSSLWHNVNYHKIISTCPLKKAKVYNFMKALNINYSVSLFE